MIIFKNSFIYIAVSVFSGALSYLLIPILTNNLSPTSFGTFEIYRSSIALLQGLMIFGTNTLIFGNFFKWSKRELNIFLHNSIFIFTLVSLLLISLMITIPQIEYYLEKKMSFSLLVVVIGIVTVYFQSVTSLQTTIFQIHNKAVKYAIFTAGFSFVSFISSFILVLYYNFDWHGPLLAILFASFLFFAISIFNFSKLGIRIKYPLNKVKTILYTGTPLIFTHISGWIIEAIDKYMISSVLDMSSTGNYSVNYRFSMIVSLIQVGVLRAWAPFFFKEINTNTIESKKKVVKFSYFLIIFLLVITFVTILVSPYVFPLLIKNNQYIFSGDVIFYVCIGYFFDGLWKIFAQYLINKNQTLYYAVILIFVSVCNVILNHFLIRTHGIEGSAIATCLSFFLGFLMTLSVASWYNPMPWLYKKVL